MLGGVRTLAAVFWTIPGTTLLRAGLVPPSGVPALRHRRYEGDEGYWAVGELVYAPAPFVSLLYGVYGFFGRLFHA